jgi:hypothetical protein
MQSDRSDDPYELPAARRGDGRNDPAMQPIENLRQIGLGNHVTNGSETQLLDAFEACCGVGRRMLILRPTLFLALIVGTLLPATAAGIAPERQAALSHASTPTPAPSINPMFQSLLPTLKASTTVPVLLPAYVPTQPSGWATLDARLGPVDAQSYVVAFETSTTCDFSQTCTVGNIDSFPATGSVDTTLFSQYQSVTLMLGRFRGQVIV